MIIDFLKQQNTSFDLPSLLLEYECFTSIIVKLELLKSSAISANEEKNIYEFLKFVPVIPLTETIINETITLSRASTLKLPDAIIGATAITYNAEIVTRDPHFEKCQYEKIRVWKKTGNSP